MFRFENWSAFEFLLLIPILLALFFAMDRVSKRRVSKVYSARLLPVLVGNLSSRRRRMKRWLQILSLVFLVLALARPQMGQSLQKVKSDGIELVILFDVSRSMLAEDVRPSRLEFAKSELIKFVQNSGGDRMGLVAFAGSAVLMSPVTNDKGALQMYIESLSTNSVGTQGTEIKKALDEASAAFRRGGVDEGQASRVTRAIVVISDGEDHEQGAETEAAKLSGEGIRVFALAVGTEAGGKIPLRDERGIVGGYARDRQGAEIISKTDGSGLKAIAKSGKGSFYHLTFGGNAAESLRQDILKLDRSEFDSIEQMQFDEKFQIFLLLAIILGMIELLLTDKKSPSGRWKGRFEVAALIGVLVLVLSPKISWADSDVNSVYLNDRAQKHLTLALQALQLEEVKKAISDLQKQKKEIPPELAEMETKLQKEYGEINKNEQLRPAEQYLLKAVTRRPRNCRLRLNLGLLQELQGNLDKSIQEYSTATQICDDKSQEKFAGFANLGRVYAEKKSISEALSSYQSALSIIPNSIEVKTNIELLFQGGGGGQGDGGQNEEPQKEGDNADKIVGGQETKRVDPGDVRRILDELKEQEQKIRAEMNKDQTKDRPKDKDW